MLSAPTSIILGILGFALLIAGLDFLKRRAGPRILTAPRHPIPPDPLPKIVRPQMNPVAESRTVATIGGIASLPHRIHAAPGLPFGEFVAMPKPGARLPPNRA